MASKNERAEKRAALIELMDQGCLENSRGALVGTGMWVVPKKERGKRRLTPGYQDVFPDGGGEEKQTDYRINAVTSQARWTTARRNFPTLRLLRHFPKPGVTNLRFIMHHHDL